MSINSDLYYNLSSGEIDNNESKILISKFPEKTELLKKSGSQEKIAFLIFNDNITDELFKTLSVSLTISCDFKLPIQKHMADLLFFTLCRNYECCKTGKKENRICNFTQANTLYELYEGDYSKIEEINDEDNRRFRFTTIKGRHNILFPGFNIVWKIPVGFYRDPKTNENKVTLSGLAYCELEINSETYRIPRKMYIQFFKENLQYGRLICNSTDEIKSMFNQNDNDSLFEIFKYLGYHIKQNFKNIPLPSWNYDKNIYDNRIVKQLFLEENKICCYIGGAGISEEYFDNIKNNVDVYWKPMNNLDNRRYILLPEYNYIPLNNNGENFITILGV